MASKKDIVTFPLNLTTLRAFMGVNEALWRCCPFCAARPGRGCTTLRGRKRKIFHAQRWRNA